MPRKYEQTARAVRRGATRQRIIEAIAGLHTEVGPALTTVSEIAERAGVERLTVYRHFPDEASMYQACGAYVYSLHPPPDVEGWKTIEDPLERLTRGLAELYVFYAQTERITANVLRDEKLLPVLARTANMGGWLTGAADVLVQAWTGAERDLVSPLVRPGASFYSWQLLTQVSELSNQEVVQLIARLVVCVTS